MTDKTTSSEWMQGDIFTGALCHRVGPEGKPVGVVVSTPPSRGQLVALISQSCDVARQDREYLQVAPVVRLEEPDGCKNAAARRRPQFVPLPNKDEDGNQWFVDLDGITTVHRRLLQHETHVSRLTTEQDQNNFARDVARRYRRPGYPDDFNAYLAPFTDKVKKKVHKNGTIGKVLGRVHSFRAHCLQWDDDPLQVTLYAILRPDEIPLLSDEELDAAGAPSRPQPQDNEVEYWAQMILASETPANHRESAWIGFLEALLQPCHSSEERRISPVEIEAYSLNHFTYDKLLASQPLDLDYLSLPRS